MYNLHTIPQQSLEPLSFSVIKLKFYYQYDDKKIVLLKIAGKNAIFRTATASQSSCLLLLSQHFA